MRKLSRDKMLHSSFQSSLNAVSRNGNSSYSTVFTLTTRLQKTTVIPS
jgi:hypothetical protein